MNPLQFFRCCLVSILMLTSTCFAAISCSVTATGLGVLYNPASNTDDTGTVTLNCTRLATDPTSISYRLYINNGIYSTGSVASGQRRLSHTSLASTYVNYGIYRNAARSQHWRAPLTGTTNVVTGTLNFSGATFASISRLYYLRVPSGQTTAPAGIYTDTLQVSARYPNNNSGTLTNLVPISMTLAIGNQCVFRTHPYNIALNYSSFSMTNVTNSTTVSMRCTNLLPYSVAVVPNSGNLLGLDYTMAVDMTNVTGTGLDQVRTVTATMPAGQSGTCATGVCTASQLHTVEVTY